MPKARHRLKYLIPKSSSMCRDCLSTFSDRTDRNRAEGPGRAGTSLSPSCQVASGRKGKAGCLRASERASEPCRGTAGTTSREKAAASATLPCTHAPGRGEGITARALPRKHPEGKMNTVRLPKGTESQFANTGLVSTFWPVR